jgi:signal transduction histidine kinase
MNIIKNGCQSIMEKQKSSKDSAKGTLAIKTLKENDYAVVIFHDTGTGMPKDVQERMFEPFFTTQPMGEGMGLGLSVSYGIIKRHRGRFEVNSEEGKGTTIILYLPLMREIKSSEEGR